MPYPALSAPGRIGRVTIRNRIVVPAINSNYTHAAMMTDLSVDSYVRKARGGAGLIIVEATSVDYPQSRSVMNPALDDDRYMEGFRRIAEGCHAEGAAVFTQLTHVGRQTKKRASGMDPVAPSPIAGNSPLYPDRPRVLTPDEIRGIVRKFGEAALRAMRCGMDGVEVHMGHGYLVNNFLTPLSNAREDEYGGLAGGIRFACEIVSEIKRVCGKDFPVSCRINGDDFVPRGGNTIVEMSLAAQRLVEAGCDVLNVTGGMRDSELNFNDHTCGTEHAAWLSLAERIRRTVSVPVITVKRFTPALAEQAVSSGAADFVAFAKQSIADPDFANKILSGREEDMLPCISCSQGCYDRLWMWLPVTCAFNPEAAMTEAEIAAHRALLGDSRVLVVGAGPAGCTVACELARMGHDTTLIERADRIGGQYAAAAETVRKREIEGVLAWMRRRLDRAGVRLRLGTPLTPELLLRESYDLAVDATGAPFFVPETPEGAVRAVGPEEALRDPEALGRYVTIVTCPSSCPWRCGARHHPIPDDVTGCETNESQACAAGFAAADLAETLAARGVRVEILTERPAFAQGMGFTNRNYLMKRLFSANVSVSCGVTVRALQPGGLLCEKEGMPFRLAADAVVFCDRQRRDGAVTRMLSDAGLPVTLAGDCRRPGNVLEAVHDAYRIAEQITRAHPARG